MNRYDLLKKAAFAFLSEKNPEYAPVGIAHLAYSAALAALIARRRGLDMELAQAAGYLHDVWLHWHYPYDQETCARHAAEGALLAGQMMRETGAYKEEEIAVVVRMIENHDFLDQIDDPMSEVMKDADMLSHYLNASAAGREGEFNIRVSNVLAEFAGTTWKSGGRSPHDGV